MKHIVLSNNEWHGCHKGLNAHNRQAGQLVHVIRKALLDDLSTSTVGGRKRSPPCFSRETELVAGSLSLPSRLNVRCCSFLKSFRLQGSLQALTTKPTFLPRHFITVPGADGKLLMFNGHSGKQLKVRFGFNTAEVWTVTH